MVGGVVLDQSVDPEDGRWRPASRWENCQEISKMEIPVGFDVELVYPFLGYVQAVCRLQGNLLTVKVEGGGIPKTASIPAVGVDLMEWVRERRVCRWTESSRILWPQVTL